MHLTSQTYKNKSNFLLKTFYKNMFEHIAFLCKKAWRNNIEFMHDWIISIIIKYSCLFMAWLI